METAEYGPFTDGYVAAVDKTSIGRNAISEDSKDCTIDPTTHAITERLGSAIRFDTFGALVGLLEAKWNARVRHLWSFESDSFADGQPNISGLWTDETDKEGQVWFRSSNGAGTNQVFGGSYGTTHRSQANVTPWHFLMIPLHTEHATDKWTRCKSVNQRKVLFSGARKALRVGKGVLAPNRTGTPIWHNGKFNDSSVAGTEKEFIRPLGPMPPIFQIRRLGTSGVTTTGTWLGHDTAFWAYAYRFENGDVSAPMLCAPNQSIEVDIGTPGGIFDYVSLFVPPGPPDCIERLIFRTNKWDASAASPDIQDPTALLLTGVIRNNFQTTYHDFGGDDASLRSRPDLIRFDLIMPPKARSAFTFDNRIAFCDLAINTAVIELAPYSADSVAVNLDGYMFDQAGAYGNPWFYWWNDGTNLKLKHNIGGVWAAAIVDLSIALAGQTLQNVVDAINAVVPNVGVWTWRAQLLPGVDGNALATELETTSGSDYFDDDTRANDGTSGNQRVICGQTLPGVLYMSKTSSWATSGTDKRALHFTMANPAGTGTDADAPLMPNAWRGGYDCRRRLEGGMGRIVGGSSLLDGGLIYATNGIAVIRNIRGGKTGVDSDYRVEKWKAGSGILSWAAYAEGDGWGVYVSRKGVMVNDGKREVCISKRVWNHRSNGGVGRGPWAYEFGQCKKWVAADDDSAHLHVSVAHGRIYIAYRSSNAVAYPDRYMYYDFSAGINEIGVDQVLREDGEPFPWSAPISIRASQMAVVARSDGDHMYAAIDDLGAGHSTGDGTVTEIELAGAYDDNGSSPSMLAYLQSDRFGAVREKKRVSKLDLEYFDATGFLKVSGHPNVDRSTTGVIANPVDVVTDGTITDSARLRFPVELRGPIEQLELKMFGAVAGHFEVRRAVVTFRRLRTTKPT